VTPARLAVMRSLEEEFNEATLAERRSLIESKVKLLEGDADPAAVEALEVDLSAFLDRVDTFLEERSARLGDVGLRASQLQALLADWSMAWLRGTGVYAPPIEFIDRARIPPHTAAFLGAAINTDTTTIAAERDVVAQAGPLVIERSVDDPTVLLVRGEIDAANSDTLATAVLSALGAVGDVTVDFHEVLFCDLSGLRALVRASATVSGDQRLRVTGLPGHLHRVLRLVGWTDLPGLVIEAYSGA
jgi:anti-anti-sigma factor